MRRSICRCYGCSGASLDRPVLNWGAVWLNRNLSGKGDIPRIACCMYGHSSSVVARAFEISVSKDKLATIHRCVAVVDCGLVIDLDRLKAHVEGSLVLALSGIFVARSKNCYRLPEIYHSAVQKKSIRRNEMPTQ